MPIMKFAKTAMKNLFSKPCTRLYPATPQVHTPVTRGSIEIDIESCIMCGICAKKCPTAAITVNRDAKTWELERFGCLACGLCVNSCPKKCLRMEHSYTTPGRAKYSDTFTQAKKPIENKD